MDLGRLSSYPWKILSINQVEEGKPDEQNIDTEVKSEFKSEDSHKLKTVWSSDEEYETGSATEDIEKDEESSQQTSTGRVLRDRSTLKKPIHFEDYAMIVEEFINQDTEDPATFEDALRSENLNIDCEIACFGRKSDLDFDRSSTRCKGNSMELKKNPDGSIDKYKGRLVVKRFTASIMVKRIAQWRWWASLVWLLE